MERKDRAEAGGTETGFFRGRGGGAVALCHLAPGRAWRLRASGGRFWGRAAAGARRWGPGASPTLGAGRFFGFDFRGRGEFSPAPCGLCRTEVGSCCGVEKGWLASASPGAAAGMFAAMERSAWMMRLIRLISRADSRSPPPLAARPRENSPSFSASRCSAAWGDGAVGVTGLRSNFSNVPCQEGISLWSNFNTRHPIAAAGKGSRHSIRTRIYAKRNKRVKSCGLGEWRVQATQRSGLGIAGMLRARRSGSAGR